MAKFNLAITALITAVATSTVLRLIRAQRHRPPNRLFLYQPPFGNEKWGKAAVATISPNDFRIERAYQFSNWTFVANAASGSKTWLFFHNSATGSAAVGWIDRNFNVRNTKYYPAGSISFPYYTATVDGRGYLMCVGFGSPGHMSVGFAQVLDDGTFVEWWRAERSDLPFPTEQPLIGLKNAHTWFANKNGGGSTVFLFDIKHGQVISQRDFDRTIHWMVADGDLIFLYFSDTLKSTELCVLDGNQQLQTLKHTEFDFASYTTHDFDRITSTPGAHLLYTRQSFKAFGAIRVLGRDGFKLTHQLSNMDWRYHFAVRC